MGAYFCSFRVRVRPPAAWFIFVLDAKCVEKISARHKKNCFRFFAYLESTTEHTIRRSRTLAYSVRRAAGSDWLSLKLVELNVRFVVLLFYNDRAACYFHVQPIIKVCTHIFRSRICISNTHGASKFCGCFLPLNATLVASGTKNSGLSWKTNAIAEEDHNHQGGKANARERCHASYAIKTDLAHTNTHRMGFCSDKVDDEDSAQRPSIYHLRGNDRQLYIKKIFSFFFNYTSAQKPHFHSQTLT